MPLEIERKYLVDTLKWKLLSKPEGYFYKQGYISTDPSKTIRIRITKAKSFLTIKGALTNISRPEYEYEIPQTDAEELLADFTVARIEKTRYKIMYRDNLWEVDEFSADNQGLVVAEIELSNEDKIFEIPEWVSTEVTADERYYNVNLAQDPYQGWKPKENSTNVPESIIKEIAQFMEAGMKCYLHKTSFEVVNFPDESRFPEMDYEAGELWQEDIKKVVDNPEYIEIEQMHSSESFKVMEDFVISLPESSTKIRLITALEGHKPFRNFNHQAHNAGDEREQWFRFRTERMMDWVKKQIADAMEE